MIVCAVCKKRIRPPKRPWTHGRDGRPSFYTTTKDGMRLYKKFLKDFSKRVPFVHLSCEQSAEDIGPHIIAEAR